MHSYDMILKMDFLGPCFGMLDPLTEEFSWRVDCHDIEKMPNKVARLLSRWRGTIRERRHDYMMSFVYDASDLANAALGDEDHEEELDD